VSTLASDDFNRANNASLGSNWTTRDGLGSFSISSNQASSTTDNSAAYYNAVSFPADQWSQCTVASPGGADNSGAGPAIRQNTSGVDSGYDCYTWSGGAGVWLANGGSYTKIASLTGTVANGSVVYMEAQGTTITVKVGGTSIGSFTNGTLSTGKPGIQYGQGGSNDNLDNWSGGDFDSGTQSFSYSATGGLSLSGTSAQLRARVKAAAGGITTGGAATVSRVRKQATPSGGVALGGAASFAKGKVIAAAGGITVSGAAAQLRVRVPAPAGGVALGGAADYSSNSGQQSYSYSATGGLQLAGASAEARVAARTASGGISLGGTAGNSTHEASRTVTPSGGLHMGGSAAVTSFTVGGSGDNMPLRRRRLPR